MDEKRTGALQEESVHFSVSKDVFYNPKMRFCRSMSSLALGAIGEMCPDKLEVVDAFTASGIRGIRYAKENRNVKKLTFLDIDKSAIALAKKNAKTNKLKRTSSICANISKVAFVNVADFLEIDPFGTPSPYLADSMRFFNPKKTAFLSVTATDVAVLCGGKLAACMKNYQAKPLNSSITHEIGLRIMMRRMVDVAAEFNLGLEPLISFSDQHYLKSIVRLTRSAEKAFEAQSKTGFISFCGKCGWRGSGRFPPPSCPFCGAPSGKDGIDYAGPLWLGELHDADILDKMVLLNNARDYADKERLGGFIALLQGEVGLPQYYYNMHELSRLQGIQPVKKMADALKSITDTGFIARRTHFSPVSIKTDAPYDIVLKAMRGPS